MLKLVHWAVVGAMIHVLVNVLNAHPTFLLQSLLLDEHLAHLEGSTGLVDGLFVGVKDATTTGLRELSRSYYD